MASGKFVGWFVMIALVLGAIGAGGTYLTLTLRERRLQDDLELASSLLKQKEYDRAAAVLDARLERGQGRERWYPRVLAMKLTVFEAQDQRESAREVARQLLDPDLPEYVDGALQAHAFLGWDALETDADADRAQAHFEAILDLAGVSGHGVDIARLGLIRIEVATLGVSVKVRDELVDLLEHYPESSVRADIEHVLGMCNMTMLRSAIPDGNDIIYEIQRGNTIDGLARKHKIPADLLMAVNGITNPRMLSIGRRIKIPDVDFSIEVNKATNMLILKNHGQFFKSYAVRTGKLEYMTPVGDYQVQTKKKNPSWTDPRSGKRYGPLAEGNQLGTRWIGFKGSGFGIHGTIHPETIGTYASFGCVGMLKADVEELYDLVRRTTPIKIYGKTQAKPSYSKQPSG